MRTPCTHARYVYGCAACERDVRDAEREVWDRYAAIKRAARYAVEEHRRTLNPTLHPFDTCLICALGRAIDGHSEGMTDADKAIADAVAERDRALEDRDGFEQCMFQSQEEALEAEARQENAERCAAEAIEVLEIVEGFLADEVFYCPVCGGHIHGSDCRLARVLGIGKVAP